MMWFTIMVETTSWIWNLYFKKPMNTPKRPPAATPISITRGLARTAFSWLYPTTEMARYPEASICPEMPMLKRPALRPTMKLREAWIMGARMFRKENRSVSIPVPPP